VKCVLIQYSSNMSVMEQDQAYQPAINSYLPHIRKSYAQQEWVYEDGKEEYEKLQVANANKRGFKLLWKKIKDLFPEMICALILVLAFWLKWCPSDDLCSKCQTCYKHKDCIFYTNFICKWVLSSCRKSGRHIANCFT